jgi:hypothetical protein
MLFSLIYHMPIIGQETNPYDEGIVVVAASRILAGQLPYLDFWSIYPPGQDWTTAFFFELFGTNFLVARILDIVTKALLSLVVYQLALELSGRVKIALMAWALSVLWIGFGNLPLYPVYAALIFAIAAIYLFQVYSRTSQSKFLLYCGFSTAITCLFRIDIGFYVSVALIITLGCYRYFFQQVFLKPVLLLIVGGGVLGIPLLVGLIQQVGFGNLVDQLIISPAKIIPQYRAIPYPAAPRHDNFHFFVFPVTLALGLLLPPAQCWRHKNYTTNMLGISLVALTGLLFLNQARVRSDDIHLLPAAIACVVITPSLMKLLISESNNPRTLGLSISVCCLLMLPFVQPVRLKADSFHRGDYNVWSKSAATSAGYATTGDSLQSVVSHIQCHTDSKDLIYVGAKDHDQFIANDVSIYFLAQRQPATKYHELHPGITTTEAIQWEIIQELTDSDVKLIVLTDRYWSEPNLSSENLKVNILDDFIRQQYALKISYGPYEVWHRCALRD